MASRDETDRDWSIRDPQIAVALLGGAVFALLGILAPLLSGQRGVFLGLGRNYLHDVVHLGSGLVGLAAGYYAGGAYADRYNIGMGLTYALVTLLGFVAFGFMNDLIALNTADNYFHLLLTLVFLGTGFLAGRR